MHTITHTHNHTIYLHTHNAHNHTCTQSLCTHVCSHCTHTRTLYMLSSCFDRVLIFFTEDSVQYHMVVLAARATKGKSHTHHQSSNFTLAQSPLAVHSVTHSQGPISPSQDPQRSTPDMLQFPHGQTLLPKSELLLTKLALETDPTELRPKVTKPVRNDLHVLQMYT